MGKQDNLKNEQEIISACIKRDPNAQQLLFNQYAGKLLGVCARYCTNLDDAKDALHEGFLKIFNQIDRFKGGSKLETWMTRIMIYTAIDHFKKSIKWKPMDAEQMSSIQEDEAVEIEIEEKEEISLNQIYQIISKLPDGYRIIFNLYAIEGYTHSEIAKELEISEGTSKSQLARARKLIKKMLKEEHNIG
ncbi:RNA polymerase sigma factor [bacterium]|nr:RNA polymerase sigma factor [bacterium]